MHSSRLCRRPCGILVTLVLCSISTAAGAQSASDLQVTSYQLIGTTRVDRTNFDYAYRVLVRNASGAFAANVRGQLSSLTPGTMVVAGSFGPQDIRAGEIVASETITIRQDRRVTFSPSGLRWSFTVNFVVGAVLPADPGPAGDASVAGVDVNQNGIRDDVERRLLIEYAPGEVRTALLDRAQLLGGATRLPGESGARQISERLFRNLECLYSIEPSTARERATRLTNWFLNTLDRWRSYTDFAATLGGQEIELTPIEQQASACVRETDPGN